MKILQLCKKFPFPLKDGEAIAITYLAKALNKLDCEVTLLGMNTSKHFFDEKEVPKSFDHYEAMHLVDVDNRLKIKDAFLNLFSSQSYHISRFISPHFDAKLIELLTQNDYDIVQLETLYLAPYVDTIKKYSKAKVVMRSHNVEHEIWKRITDNTSIGAKKVYLSLLTKRLENFELEYLNKYDMMVAITERDLNFFKKLGCKIPAHVTPIGLELEDYKQKRTEQKQPTFCFIGSLDWMPNIEGIEWILEAVWPKVLEAVPDAVFHIAGRNTPATLLEKKWKNVVIHGEVPSASDFINSHDVMLVPLFSGSGMRVKILEGMALGKVVLSTDLGLEGIHARHNKEVLIANEASAFAREIIRCYDNSDFVTEVGMAAADFIHQHYDNVSIANRLLDFYKELIRPRPVSKVQN
ncbi:glycosyltransferase family 4 protein [Aureispira anguillae]|uniref:Glycosyltransferase family 4 protein n=1 Tax=Aureispira anguillae TaxID=2864201 RepID=A0A916DR84_9BACT|nr:glycosyltransferase family 4 protein [Aureispira anguillae]BDS11664.1 glycosyltransferase family 4 protein [Aureispira anguillae]